MMCMLLWGDESLTVDQNIKKIKTVQNLHECGRIISKLE